MWVGVFLGQILIGIWDRIGVQGADNYTIGAVSSYFRVQWDLFVADDLFVSSTFAV